MLKIGEILLQKKLISESQLKQALAQSSQSGEILGKVLIKLNFISEAQLLEVLAQQLDIKFLPSLKNIKISQEAVKAIPAKLIWHYQFMPLDLQGRVLTIAVSDPLTIWFIEDIELRLGYSVERVLTLRQEISTAIRQYYGVGAETVEQILEQKGSDLEKNLGSEEISQVDLLDRAADNASVVRLVNQLLTEAVNSRATDIHIEPYRNKIRIRYRIDGVLYDTPVPEEIRQLHQAIVSRVKIISNLDVVEKRIAQDGRAIIRVEEKQIDLRVSIIPSLRGENVVIRILPVHLLFRLDDLGLVQNELELFQQLMVKPHGIVFLTGPTGSGKTTTLYTCLTQLNKESTKIITIEDPVEYELEGITQIQVKPEIGFTFASALRSILRHDPDIMMVGEVRDLETAELAIRTSLTGHLIFSTLHTNDAPSGITRLIDIGIEPYLVASSVNAFISQRLIRLICPHCKEPVKDSKLFPEYLKDTTVYHGKGCAQCGKVGYRGREAIYEVLVINDQLRELIVNKASAGEIKKKALSLGFKSLLTSGIEKIKTGKTTPQEVMRVVEI